jgi:hypothetical protein
MVGEHLIGKEQMPLLRQQPEDASLADRPVAQLAHRPKEIVLHVRPTHRHGGPYARERSLVSIERRFAVHGTRRERFLRHPTQLDSANVDKPGCLESCER